jgi:hypothetical protein
MRLGVGCRSRGALRCLGVTSVALALLCGFAMSVLVGKAAASSSCANEAFQVGPGAKLPDCRAYEMVSPPNKNGGQVDGGVYLEADEPAPQQAAPDGEAVTYGSQTTFTEANPLSAMPTSQYISRRTASGWVTQAVTPKQAIPGGRFNPGTGNVSESLYQGFNENLTLGYLVADEPAPVAGAPAGYYNPYLQNEENGSFTLLSDVKPPVAAPGPATAYKGLVVQYAGMTNDGEHVILEADDALTPEAAPGRVNLYEWNEGHLELVSVLPNGEVDSGGEEGIHGGEEFARMSLEFGGVSETGVQGGITNYSHALSSNGERAFWESSGLYHQIYMHELTPSGARTVEVSKSQKTNGTGPGGTDPKGPLNSHFWTASSDGSLVYFTSCAQLTNDSTAAAFEPDQYHVCNEHNGGWANGERGADLYQYDVDTGHLSDLTVDHNPGEAANVTGVIGASEDGSYVYFVAEGILAPGARSEGQYHNLSQNLYLWHDGVTSFITTLGVSDREDWEAATIFRTARVSPDGRYLAFQSFRSLTGYDNVTSVAGACAHDGAQHECIEVYEYDAQAGKLTCASCNPTGVPPIGISLVPETLHALASNPGWQSGTQQKRYLLDDGRVFFQSTDQLVPQASNGQQNIYEWEPDEVGTCHLAAGCVYLISSGTSRGPSYFSDASTDGSNVFFLTRQQLVAADGDEEMDMYDARVGGGFSAGGPPPCEGEACRPPDTPAPAIYGAPPSATFVGPGNPSAPPTGAVTVKKKSKKRAKPKKRRGVKRPKAEHSRKAGR